MSAHHPFGPSKLGRLFLCPGSHALCAKAEADGTALNPYAAEAQRGTDLHALLPPDVPIPDDIDAADRAAVESARAWIAEKTAGAVSVSYEVRVLVVDGIFPIFGTVDVRAFFGDSPTFIGDAKFGMGALEPSSIEWQMKGYAASEDFGARVGVFAARDGTEYLAEFTAPDCAQLRKDIKTIRAACLSPGAPLNPSASACRYCPATAICPAFNAHHLALAESASAALPLDPVRLARLYEAVKLVESRGDAIRDALKAAIKGGANVGYRIKEVQVRSTPSKDSILAALDPRQALNAAKFTLGELERAIGKARVRELWPNLQTTTQERLEKI